MVFCVNAANGHTKRKRDAFKKRLKDEKIDKNLFKKPLGLFKYYNFFENYILS